MFARMMGLKMESSKLISGTLLIACVLSCQQKQINLQDKADKFAAYECRAIELREKRFALADQIRFTNDSFSQNANKVDTASLRKKLESYNIEKDRMLQLSLSLADSIKNELDYLMKNELLNKEDKASFNGLLSKTLIKKGCVEKL